MAAQPIPRINYDFAPRDGHNVFREKFGSLSDDDWCRLLARSASESIIEGVQFPSFPDHDLQFQVHGNHGETAIAEAASFFKFVKKNTYQSQAAASKLKLLDFGAGWGRITRPFMRDFEFNNVYGFEPDFLFCSLARVLNPYVNYLSGKFVPSGDLPASYFHLMVGWSIFSHLSHASASLWLAEAARIVQPGGYCVFTTWGERFLRRLQREAVERAAGKEIHWYSKVCLDAAGSIDDRLLEYQRGDFVWFTSGKSTLYGEAFLGEKSLRTLILQFEMPFSVSCYDSSSLPQDVFVLKRL